MLLGVVWIWVGLREILHGFYIAVCGRVFFLLGMMGCWVLLCGMLRFPSFWCFFTSFCSGSTLPPALYVLLCGSGSSLLRRPVMYVIRLPIHGVISPVRT